MRLLNTESLQLHEFFDPQVPPYTILSHRWEGEEVTFQELQNGQAKEKQGYAKIKGCCRQAREDGFEYAVSTHESKANEYEECLLTFLCKWIDSCCIDKTSSAELSEAINSMFQWHRKAQVCYAYLSDVSEGIENPPYHRDSEFRRSLWFTRGWTLQELLAPEIVIFYNRYWAEIGTKGDMKNLVGSITGIESEYLLYYYPSGASVAMKMSWASRRTTTRVEDKAYCLMGLFGVHMPLLYGEGEKAFYRLQLEIIASSTDESIFAWEMRKPECTSDADFDDFEYTLGILATGPEMFQSCGDIVACRSLLSDERPSYEMTNKGLRIHIPGELESPSKYLPNPVGRRYQISERLLFLNCTTIKSQKVVAIHIQPWDIIDKDGFTRCRARTTLVPESLYGCKAGNTVEQWHQIILENYPNPLFQDDKKPPLISLDLRSAFGHGYLVRKSYDPPMPEVNDTSSRSDEAETSRNSLAHDLFVHGSRFEDEFRIAISHWGSLHVTVETSSHFSEHERPRTYQNPEDDIRGIALPSGKYLLAKVRKKLESGKSIYVIEVIIKETSTLEDCAVDQD
jgi:hypothetical protein